MEVGRYLASCGRYIERNPVRVGLAVNAWDYHWSSAASYVNGDEDGLTDENPYLGAFEEADRPAYAQALMSGGGATRPCSGMWKASGLSEAGRLRKP